MSKKEYIDFALLILSLSGICIFVALVFIIVLFGWFSDTTDLPDLKELEESKNEKCNGI